MRTLREKPMMQALPSEARGLRGGHLRPTGTAVLFAQASVEVVTLECGAAIVQHDPGVSAQLRRRRFEFVVARGEACVGIGVEALGLPLARGRTDLGLWRGGLRVLANLFVGQLAAQQQQQANGRRSHERHWAWCHGVRRS